MNNIVDIIFLCAHTGVYVYVTVLAYKKFIRPYLLQEQQYQQALMVQLQQRLVAAQELMQVCKKQIEYITTLFKKISYQHEQARELLARSEAERCQLDQKIQTEYEKQKRVRMYNRKIQELRKDLVPHVMHALRAELSEYAQQHGKGYLEGVINELKRS